MTDSVMRGVGDSASAAASAASGISADRRHVNRLGLFVGLGGITMLFAAFTSAYIVRSGGGDWAPLELPPAVWMSTAVIALSSATLEVARRCYRQGDLGGFRNFSALTAALGVGFLLSQLAAWRALNAAGIYLESHPKSSFFFVLTGVHGVHLIAGVVALLVLLGLALFGRLDPARSDAPTLTAIYWHFTGGLWIYLLAVLSLLG